MWPQLTSARPRSICRRAIPSPSTIGRSLGSPREVLHDLIGEEQVTDMRAPVMGSEDWSYVLQRVPGCMAFLGVCPPEAKPATAAACHSNRMQLDEDAMAVGIAAHVAMALSYLS